MPGAARGTGTTTPPEDDDNDDDNKDDDNNKGDEYRTQKFRTDEGSRRSLHCCILRALRLVLFTGEAGVTTELEE